MNYPIPHWTVSPTTQVVAGVVFGVFLIGGLAYAAWMARQERKAYPIIVMVGSGLMCFGEPFVDLMGQCMFPDVEVAPYVTAFGRVIPLYMAPVYSFYFGLVVLAVVRGLQRGIDMRRWWQLSACVAVIAIVVDETAIHFDLWRYFGENQPFRVINMPLWWAFGNTAPVLVVGVVLHVLLRRRILSGVSTLALVILVPTGAMGFHLIAAFPIYVALSASSSVLVTNLAQLLTIALAVTIVGIAGKLTIGASTRAEPAPAPATAEVRG